MEQLFYKIVGFVEGMGIVNAIVLSGIISFLFLYLVYLSIVLESYSSFGSIRDVMSFGRYQVEMKNESGSTIKVVTAWNKANAVEKTARKLNTLNEVTFVVIKL